MVERFTVNMPQGGPENIKKLTDESPEEIKSLFKELNGLEEKKEGERTEGEQKRIQELRGKLEEEGYNFETGGY